MRMRLGVACLVLGGALAAAPILAQDEGLEEEAEETGYGTLVANLTPGAVEEGAGVAGASAVFRGELDAGSGDVCYILEVKGLRDAGEAHIHRGLPGERGSVAIDLLVTGDDGDICIAKQPRDINGILNDPVGHYVDIHLRSDRRAVALRGQLAKE